MIKVSLKDLPATWEVHKQTRQIMSKSCGLRSNVTSGYFEHCDHCQGAWCYEDKEYTLVISPDGDTMLSLEHGALVFHKAPPNNYFVKELDSNKVPYVVSK